MDLAGILSTTGYVLEVLIGVSLIIFVHEFGHFLAAKWAGVKVNRFFFGFAPAFKIGKRKITLQFFAFNFRGTKYGLGMLPFGGFVDMAGEHDGEEAKEVPKEQLFTSKTPGQRAIIFVAGAVMNAIFAIVFFIVAFLIGVSFVRPTIGNVVPGYPAWQAGIRPGDKILEIDGKKQEEFIELIMKIALCDPGTVMDVKLQRGEEVIETKITPIADPGGKGMTVGITTNAEPVVQQVLPGTPAEKAGLKAGDTIIGIRYTDPQTGQFITAKVKTYLDVTRIVQDPRFLGKPVHLMVEGRSHGKGMVPEVTIVSEVSEEAPKILGIAPRMTRIAAIRDASPARTLFKKGDVIESVQGRAFYSLDQLKEESIPAGEVAVRVRRAAKAVDLTASSEDLYKWLEDDIALTYTKEESEAVAGIVRPDMPAALAGMKPGDRITQVGAEPVETFAQLSAAIRSRSGKPVELTWARQGPENSVETFSATLTPVPQRTGFVHIGIMFRQDRFVKRVSNPFTAIAIGWNRTILWGKRVFLVLKGLFTARVSARNLAGPVGIFTISYAVTQFGIGTLLYFLAMISINLAILNVFPVPVLDGGHLLFLGIEKIKGSPVSIKTQVAAQTIGLVLLLGMAVFVTINDITRLFTGY